MLPLPPLNALRAFEAAARHLSFSRAAAELNVTPAAVSHQVKALEEYLGTPLFRRLTRAVVLTEAGQAGVPALRQGFAKLGEAADLLRADETAGALTVSVAPSFGAKWLVPRLDRFAAAHPDIDIRIDASMAPADFARDGIDVAVRFGHGVYPGLHVEKLFDEEVVPVCTPALCKGPPALHEPADLRRHTLIHIALRGRDQTWPDWPMWLRSAGVEGIDATRGPRFSVDSMAVQAALEGQGVALVNSALVADDLAAGRLVKAFELAMPVSFSYYIVCPEFTAERPKVAAFRAWIVDQARRMEDDPALDI